MEPSSFSLGTIVGWLSVCAGMGQRDPVWAGDERSEFWLRHCREV